MPPQILGSLIVLFLGAIQNQVLAKQYYSESTIQRDAAKYKKTDLLYKQVSPNQIINVNSGAIFKCNDYLQDCFEESFSWSKNGKFAAFNRWENGKAGVSFLNIETSQYYPIYASKDSASQPIFNSDSKYILWKSFDVGFVYDINTYNIRKFHLSDYDENHNGFEIYAATKNTVITSRINWSKHKRTLRIYDLETLRLKYQIEGEITEWASDISMLEDGNIILMNGDLVRIYNEWGEFSRDIHLVTSSCVHPSSRDRIFWKVSQGTLAFLKFCENKNQNQSHGELITVNLSSQVTFHYTIGNTKTYGDTIWFDQFNAINIDGEIINVAVTEKKFSNSHITLYQYKVYSYSKGEFIGSTDAIESIYPEHQSFNNITIDRRYDEKIYFKVGTLYKFLSDN